MRQMVAARANPKFKLRCGSIEESSLMLMVAATAGSSRFFRHAVCVVGAVPLWLAAQDARGQACCAGSGAVTPGRLALHENALVGLEAKIGAVPGSYDFRGTYVPYPPGAGEIDLEQDAFGAVRIFKRGQVALLVPLVETWRSSLGRSELGGGIGDINASVRYDFTTAGSSRTVPGLAALGGVTFPTGKPADATGIGALATGATGVGAYQLNFGIAVEQTFGAWLVNATGIIAGRTARTVGSSGPSAVDEQLAPQWTLLAAVAYTFPNDWAAALSASYAFEGDATVNGADAADTSHRLLTVSLSGVAPLSDVWRLQGAVFDNPPIDQLGLNLTADVGASLTLVRSWL